MPEKYEISILTPFKYPLLCIRVRKSDGSGEDWLIDVEGQIQGYFLHEQGDPDLCLPLMRLCIMLASEGLEVTSYGSYYGSGGPSHIIRNGIIFRKTKLEIDARQLVLNAELKEEAKLKEKFKQPKFEANW